MGEVAKKGISIMVEVHLLCRPLSRGPIRINKGPSLPLEVMYLAENSRIINQKLFKPQYSLKDGWWL